MYDLGTLGGSSSYSFANGINDFNEVAGSSDITGDTASHAFLSSGGVMTDLGTLGGTESSAVGINNAHQVVGSSQITGDTAYHAFLYSGGVMSDLNTSLPSGSGWVLWEARAINDLGQIVGLGVINGTSHAFLMSPISPSQQTANILSFYDSSVSNGTLAGSGPGNSAKGRLKALKNMIEAAEYFIIAGNTAGACQQLMEAYNRTDGLPRTPDFVAGQAASELAPMIQDLRANLECH